jgi:hypothetical protein
MSFARFLDLVAWLGTLCLAIAPFIIDTPEGKILAMFGLSLLMFQAAEKCCYNLLFLNTLGIIGYLYALNI